MMPPTPNASATKTAFDKKQAFLAFGHYTDELPEPKERIRSQTISKMASASGTWQDRQVILTRSFLLIAKPGAAVVSETIPLHEIERVTAIANEAEEEIDIQGMLEQKSVYKRKGQGRSTFAFQIFMSRDSATGNRSYSFRTDNKKDNDEWVEYLTKVSARALRWHQSNNPDMSPTLRIRMTLKRLYKSIPCQAFLSVLIMINFVLNLLDSEFMPEEGSETANAFVNVDNAFLIFFIMELMFCIFVWGKNFFNSGWRCFDFVVIGFGGAFSFFYSGQKYSVLRLVRVFRVIKGFQLLSSFRLIINALTRSVLPVFSAFVILIVVMCICAVMAVFQFGEGDPVNFGNLSRALFSIFKVTTGDGWSEIARYEMDVLYSPDDATDKNRLYGDTYNRFVAFFFIAIVLVCGIVLTNVVVAVLLDEFVQSVSEEKKAEAQAAMHKANQALEHRGPLDPLLAPLTHFNTQEDLLAKLEGLFHLVDVDDNGCITLDEMQKFMEKAGIALSDEDWTDIFSYKFTGEDTEMNLEEFIAFMHAQLKLYVQRHIASAMLEAETSASHKDSAVLFVLKHLIVAMETLMRGQDEIHERQEKFRTPASFPSETRQQLDTCASRINGLELQMKSVDQKLDVVLRFLGKSSSAGAVNLDGNDRHAAGASAAIGRAASASASDSQSKNSDSLAALWDGIATNVGLGSSNGHDADAAANTTKKRSKAVPNKVPMSAYLPVSYERERPGMAVRGDLVHVTTDAAQMDKIMEEIQHSEVKEQETVTRMWGGDRPKGEKVHGENEAQEAHQHAHQPTQRKTRKGQGVLVKVPWRSIRRKFWKRPGPPPEVEACLSCPDCNSGFNRQGFVLRDSKYVLLVIDDALDHDDRGVLSAHELLPASGPEAQGATSAADVCYESLEPLGLSSVARQIQANGKQGSMLSSDGRHSTLFLISAATQALPDALLQAATEVSFADGIVVIPESARRNASHLPAKVTVDETTLRLIGQVE